MENKSCPGPGTLTRQELEKPVYDEMVKKMREFQTLRSGKAEGYNPKLTAARAKLAKIESEIEKLIDTLTGANPLLLQYANSRIEELDTERQKQLKLVADLTANSVSTSQLDSISGYLENLKIFTSHYTIVKDVLLCLITVTTLSFWETSSNIDISAVGVVQ
ncbi:hypothetical protein [Pseudoflavonifractor sp. 524-17]|uniref:hypothetical protein n=1 Tax=Pseudoflavonifractor sp. 524-17 TaxID=2304577 RepID=UPI001FABEE41|nr:hypothetical protein [Pseudoflavonifractor sp. 524-17]